MMGRQKPVYNTLWAEKDPFKTHMTADKRPDYNTLWADKEPFITHEG